MCDWLKYLPPMAQQAAMMGPLGQLMLCDWLKYLPLMSRGPLGPEAFEALRAAEEARRAVWSQTIHFPEKQPYLNDHVTLLEAREGSCGSLKKTR